LTIHNVTTRPKVAWESRLNYLGAVARRIKKKENGKKPRKKTRKKGKKTQKEGEKRRTTGDLMTHKMLCSGLDAGQIENWGKEKRQKSTSVRLSGPKIFQRCRL